MQVQMLRVTEGCSTIYNWRLKEANMQIRCADLHLTQAFKQRAGEM